MTNLLKFDENLDFLRNIGDLFLEAGAALGRPLAFLSCDWRFQKVVSKSVRALAEILGTFCAQNPGDRDDFRVIFWEVESA